MRSLGSKKLRRNALSTIWDRHRGLVYTTVQLRRISTARVLLQLQFRPRLATRRLRCAYRCRLLCYRGNPHVVPPPAPRYPFRLDSHPLWHFHVACDATHRREIWNVWRAQYWLAGVLKAATVLASVGTTVVLVIRAPHLVKVPDLRDWAAANTALELRVESRATELRAAYESLRHSRDALALAHRAGRMGSWDRGLATGRSTWTTELEEVFGVQPRTFNDTLATVPRTAPTVILAPIRTEENSALAPVDCCSRSVQTFWRFAPVPESLLHGERRRTYWPDRSQRLR
jgi:hypothetical protein